MTINKKTFLIILFLLLTNTFNSFLNDFPYSQTINLIQPAFSQTRTEMSPQQVYENYLKAQINADLSSYKLYVNRALRNEIITQPEAEKYFKLGALMTPRNVKIINTNISGNQTIMNVTGFISFDKNLAKGVVVLVKEADGWKVKSEEWKSTSPDGKSSSTYSVGPKNNEN